MRKASRQAPRIALALAGGMLNELDAVLQPA
jgi:hypothetical protein